MVACSDGKIVNEITEVIANTILKENEFDKIE